MFGPIYSLRLFGLVCPCCETSENASARASITQIHRLGSCVDWYPVTSSKSGGLRLSRLFGRDTKADEETATRSEIKVVDATKDSINNGLPYPELQIKPLPQPEGDQETTPNSKLKIPGLSRQTASYHLDIPLHHIESIESVDATMILLIIRDTSSLDEQKLTKPAARLGFASSEDRDAIALDLQVLVQWNQQRQPEMDEELQVDGLRARAQKAAHFAKRELEMRETKRNREQRKAKYMEGKTGLKYTAMAMANREMT